VKQHDDEDVGEQQGVSPTAEFVRSKTEEAAKTEEE